MSRLLHRHPQDVVTVSVLRVAACAAFPEFPDPAVVALVRAARCMAAAVR
ncbi:MULTISPECIES: hypothetical protein [Stenotrophomonas]|uniref:Uncharacterized protein n=1 Tax=Stenotrophomonas lactitubi TaxID=2045214 RepID=A0AAW4GPH4_9GAMM|nr:MULTISPECIES: hypothetical protein [Stenotrophomonas]MBM9915726.1 hypothetical protein [Stenotrophomonas lactitubi]MBM9921358.1 hypothetical protein [Stenotrophomonas lactitubi]MBM9940007.1 hypothetical protein [Stenotrophomonas lactitubi]NYT97866.1 hypothetical protein [Stenotrophomonas sp. SbOxS2]